MCAGWGKDVYDQVPSLTSVCERPLDTISTGDGYLWLSLDMQDHCDSSRWTLHLKLNANIL